MRPGLHRAAPLAALPLTITLWGALSLTQAPLAVFRESSGELTFRRRCQVCHSVTPGESDRYGPNLSAIGGEAALRKPRMSAEQYIVEAIVDPGAYRTPGAQDTMPAQATAGLSREQIGDVAAYLLQQGGRPDYWRLTGALARVQPRAREVAAMLPLDRLEAGRRLFFGKGECARCHSLRSLPGSRLRAPDLTAMRGHEEADLFESIRKPSRRIVGGYEASLVWLKSGELCEGRLMRQTAERLDLLVENESGDLLTRGIYAAEVAKVQRSAISPMPERDDLSDDEIRQLVDFLRGI